MNSNLTKINGGINWFSAITIKMKVDFKITALLLFVAITYVACQDDDTDDNEELSGPYAYANRYHSGGYSGGYRYGHNGYGSRYIGYGRSHGRSYGGYSANNRYYKNANRHGHGFY